MDTLCCSSYLADCLLLTPSTVMSFPRLWTCTLGTRLRTSTKHPTANVRQCHQPVQNNESNVEPARCYLVVSAGDSGMTSVSFYGIYTICMYVGPGPLTILTFPGLDHSTTQQTPAWTAVTAGQFYDLCRRSKAHAKRRLAVTSKPLRLKKLAYNVQRSP